MKIAACIVLFSMAAFVAAENDAGHFIPRAFYTLDAEGHQSELHLVHPNVGQYLRRLRRSPSSYSASSSSSSSTVVGADDGQTYFSSSQLTQHTSDPVVGATASRKSGSSNSGGTHGQVLHTVGMVDKKGRLHTRTQHGHF